ncbi:MAG: hypothetical protein AB1724_04925 [Thermodesulfobacteriota bacterium]
MIHRRFSDTAAIGLIVAYLGLLCFRYGSIPGGISNDAAQEVMTGYNAVWRDGFPVMAFDPHTNGVETLWVGIAGVLVAVLGHDTLAAVMSSWLAVVLMLVFLFLLARQHRKHLDPLIVVLVAMTLPWLFHYGRGALRGISSATFMAASLAGLSCFLQNPRGWRGPLALGTPLALGIYAYTSSRIPPLAYAVVAIIHIATAPGRRRAWFVQHLRTVIIATIVSIPNIIYAAANPLLFFCRGAYNTPASPADRIHHVADSLAVPLWYRNDLYNTIIKLRGEGLRWAFDAAAVVLPKAGISPVPIIIGLAALAGLILWRIRRREYGQLHRVLLLAVLTYLAAALLIGFMGPSLTRLTVMIPIVVLLASLPLTLLARKFGGAGRAGVILLLAILLVQNTHDYFRLTPQTRWDCTSHAAMSAARVAARIAGQGNQVLLIVSRDLNAARYYSFDHRRQITVSEFHQRPFDPVELEPATGQVDAIVVSLDPIGGPYHHAPQMREAARYYSCRYKIAETGEDPPYVVFETGKPGRRPGSSPPGIPGGH